MDIKKIRINKNRRCSKEDLETILKNLPIKIIPDKKLVAYMGLGKIIHMEPTNGREINEVKIGEISIERQDYLFFEYKGQGYEIKYK